MVTVGMGGVAIGIFSCERNFTFAPLGSYRGPIPSPDIGIDAEEGSDPGILHIGQLPAHSIICDIRLLGYGDRLNPVFWWAQLESNQPPHAYQACALTI